LGWQNHKAEVWPQRLQRYWMTIRWERKSG